MSDSHLEDELGPIDYLVILDLVDRVITQAEFEFKKAAILHG